jgi:hypothetical protein
MARLGRPNRVTETKRPISERTDAEDLRTRDRNHSHRRAATGSVEGARQLYAPNPVSTQDDGGVIRELTAEEFMDGLARG